MGERYFTQQMLEEGKALLEAGALQSLQFAEGLYQLTIWMEKSQERFYPLLQLDAHGKLLDALCECTKGLEERVCVHLAASWLKIFNGTSTPLHLRFHDSLWHALFKIVAEKNAFNFIWPKKSQKREWKCISFALKGRSQKGWRAFLADVGRMDIPLESMLKFASLSPEDHLLWRQGRAAPELIYRLSHWYDLAEWFFQRQEKGEEYRVKFLENSKLPSAIEIEFADVTFTVDLEESVWPALIPKLRLIQAPLRVFFSQYPPIEQGRYDAEKEEIHFIFGSLSPLSEPKEGSDIILLDEWFFVPGVGFFPLKSDPLLGKERLAREEIGQFLDQHSDLAQQVLDVGVDSSQKSVKYRVRFQETRGLEIEGYLFTPADLTDPGVRQYGHWIYLPGKGFFSVESCLPSLQITIPKEEISTFIEQHRRFLSEHEGFQIHLSTIDAQLYYRFSADNSLQFKFSLEDDAAKEGIFDIGEWVYVRGRGFYPKARQSNGVYPGLLIQEQQISAFIDEHEQDLEAIPQFFASRSPIAAVGLSVSIEERVGITVTPTYQMISSIPKEEVKILGRYTYISGEGFARIPSSFQLPPPFTRKRVIPEIQEANFILYQLEQLKPLIVSLDQRLIKPDHLVLKLRHFSRSSSANLNWSLDLLYESSIGQVSAQEIRDAIDKRKLYLPSPAGLILLDAPRFAWLREEPQRARSKRSLRIHLNTMECFKLAALEQVVDSKGAILTTADWQLLFEQALGVQAPSLEGLRSELRTYQTKGVEWLWMLYTQGLSGLLCDEMGLGKTHQTMALVAAMRNWDPERAERRVLIVCPTSVIFHWQELFAKFLPEAELQLFHHVGRDRDLKENKAEITIISYGLLRNSGKRLFSSRFALAVFDEIQVAKNPNSLTHHALKKIRADMRLGLTGTPIENRLLDLEALFDIILPKYLPKNCEQMLSMDRQGEGGERNKLFFQKLIGPFILRRKKTDVLKELPEKIEENYYCTLSADQLSLYQQVLQREVPRLLAGLEETTKPIGWMHFFAVLTKLKQICDHPSLVLQDSTSPFAYHSGKWDLFLEILHESLDSGQKIVVFSQFVKMLDIIEGYLDEKAIRYAGIRGATRDRQAEVVRFRDDPECKVFVASLQAAGVGIDLISASIVIHYDRWWNPAKENQATDRVHRIGQTRGVQVLKLITKDTIEEYIDQLIAKKIGLLNEAIVYDEQELLKRFDRAELIELLRGQPH
jgi:SNF2 family DNA or RNA helicase